MIYADGVNVLGRSVHTIKKNAAPLVVASKENVLEVNTVKKNAAPLVLASKENVLEVNADKTKYVVMSQDQYAG
jgi:hypothetical protein